MMKKYPKTSVFKSENLFLTGIYLVIRKPTHDSCRFFIQTCECSPINLIYLIMLKKLKIQCIYLIAEIVVLYSLQAFNVTFYLFWNLPCYTP